MKRTSAKFGIFVALYFIPALTMDGTEDDAAFPALMSLLGEPGRAKMLWQLLDGRALTATELAHYADVSPQSASAHLAKLVAAELLVVERQGRHRYYCFARPEVAYALEAVANLVPPTRRTAAQPPTGLRYVRTCYDHLAGRVAVDICQALIERGMLLEEGPELTLTPAGQSWFADLGVGTADLIGTGRRVLARPCLDWSERRRHLAGTLGAALLRQLQALGWLRSTTQAREVILTPAGQSGLYEQLGIRIHL